MSYYDSKRKLIVTIPPRDVPLYPGWQQIDCGCCAGLVWGGEQPRECRRCGGDGYIFLHVVSGALAQYPGGPFVGKEPKGVQDASKTP